jgi:arylsulfatase A-like enzyme
MGASLEGIRSGKWKLWVQTGRLYDLDSDAAETTDLAAAHPETVATLAKLAAEMGAELASHARKRSDAH